MSLAAVVIEGIREMAEGYLVRFPNATEGDHVALEALLQMVGEREVGKVEWSLACEEKTVPGVRRQDLIDAMAGVDQEFDLEERLAAEFAAVTR